MSKETSIDGLISCISNPLRLSTIRLLVKEPSLSFTDIMRKLDMDVKVDTGRFGYHLRKLVDEGIIKLNPSIKKYELTELGRFMADLISRVEDAAGGTRSLLVRTSKLQMEPFDRNKIAEALQREAGVSQRLAAEIARDAEERILRMNVKYLTAPLIREIVNAILIEKNLEEYRHSLTRLGLPVYDVTMLIKSSSRTPSPEYLFRKVGGNTLAEYTLLKVLPRHVADAHLSGYIHICDLPGWAFSITTIHHDLGDLLILSKTVHREKALDLSKATIVLSRLLRMFESYVSIAQNLDSFNIFLAPLVKDMSLEETRKELHRFINDLNWSYVLRQNLGPVTSLTLDLSVPRHLASLEVPQGGVYGDYEEEAERIAEALLDILSKGPSEGGLYVIPHVMINIRDFTLSSEAEKIFKQAHEVCSMCGIPSFINLTAKWQGRGASYSAFFSRLGSEWKGDWELDTVRAGSMGEVVVNVPRLAYEAEGNDDTFIEKLSSLIDSVVSAFIAKREYLSESLSEGSLPPLSYTLQDGLYLRLEACSFNISLIGLPEAVKIHVGEHIHESQEASFFGVRILRFLKSHLDKISRENELRLLPSLSPCEDPSSRFALADIKKFSESKLVFQGSKQKAYYTLNHLMVRSIHVPLKRRAKLEGVFHPLTPGGHIMLLGINETNPDNLALLTCKLFEGYGIGALTYDKTFTYCHTCCRVFKDVRSKCPSCGAFSTHLTYYGKSLPVLKPSTLWSFEEKDSILKAYKYVM